MNISIVIPIFNEVESLPSLVEELDTNLENFGSWEIIFVDDGSSDGSTEFLSNLCLTKPEYRLVQFHRNYGKSAALSEGFKAALGLIFGDLSMENRFFLIFLRGPVSEPVIH